MKIVPVTCQVLVNVFIYCMKSCLIPKWHKSNLLLPYLTSVHVWANAHLLQLSWPPLPPPPFFFFFFDKLVMRHLQLMHISRNYFCQASSMTCPWDMTCSETHRSIKPNLSRTMQIMTNSIIPHYALHANLPNSRKSEGLAVLLKGTLSEWMMVKEHSQSPSSSNPSCGHLCPKTTEQPFLLCNSCIRINSGSVFWQSIENDFFSSGLQW